MGAPSDKEQGDRKSFKLRAGINVPGFRGVNRQKDAGALGIDELVSAENVRLTGTGIRNRDGLTPINTTPLTGTVYGIYDDGAGMAPSGTNMVNGARVPPQLYIAGTDLYAYDPIGGVVTVENPSGAYPHCGMIVHDGELVFGGVSNAHDLTIADVFTLQPASASAQAFLKKSGITSTSDSEVVTAVASLQGKLYILKFVSTGGGPTESARCSVWDGTSVVSNETLRSGSGAGLNGGVLIAYREDIYFSEGGSTPGPQVFKVRDGGAWSDIAFPGTVTNFFAYSGIVFKDVLYIGGIGTVSGADHDVILAFDGTTCALARDLGVGGGGFGGMAVIAGRLHYPWRHKIGTFDGTTWNDSAANLAVTIGAGAVAVTMQPFLDELYIFEGGAANLYRTSGQNVSGSLTLVASIPGAQLGGFDPVQLSAVL